VALLRTCDAALPAERTEGWLSSWSRPASGHPDLGPACRDPRGRGRRVPRATGCAAAGPTRGPLIAAPPGAAALGTVGDVARGALDERL